MASILAAPLLMILKAYLCIADRIHYFKILRTTDLKC